MTSKERKTERDGNKEVKSLLTKSTAVIVMAVSAEHGQQNKTKQNI
jgi:hypothetical protein